MKIQNTKILKLLIVEFIHYFCDFEVEFKIETNFYGQSETEFLFCRHRF